MADKEVLERILSMLPEEFQDIYDDTIPEAKEIRKKMGKKVSSVKSYSCAMPMFEDIRKLNYKGQAQVCKTFHQYLTKYPKVVSFFLDLTPIEKGDKDYEAMLPCYYVVIINK